MDFCAVMEPVIIRHIVNSALCIQLKEHVIFTECRRDGKSSAANKVKQGKNNKKEYGGQYQLVRVTRPMDTVGFLSGGFLFDIHSLGGFLWMAEMKKEPDKNLFLVLGKASGWKRM
jgi:hypothetical protein